MTSRYYNSIKSRYIHEMKEDSNSQWRERGHGFESYQPRSEDPIPSEWYLPLYMIRSFRHRLGRASSSLGIYGDSRSERQSESVDCGEAETIISQSRGASTDPRTAASVSENQKRRAKNSIWSQWTK